MKRYLCSNNNWKNYELQEKSLKQDIGCGANRCT